MISSDKKRIAITLRGDKIDELKAKADEAGMSLSNYLSTAGSIGFDQVVRQAELDKTNNK